MPRETWVQLSRIAVIQEVNDGCEVRILNDVGWTTITSYETVANLIERIRQASLN